ncbi:MAG: S8/S53 family peptidase [Bacilli bacterium]|jgi:hypothetical protein|nr:S8/S53 family peptidase [Bacilli bacterium]
MNIIEFIKENNIFTGKKPLKTKLICIISFIILFICFLIIITKPQSTTSKIAFIDTGLNVNQVNFNNNINISKYNVFDNSNNIEDKHLHGTNIISALYSKNSGFQLNNDFLMIKALDNQGHSKAEDIVKAVKYACNDKDVNILNLSLSLNAYNKEVDKEINTCLNKNIIVVASAGLDSNSISFPANINGVISVGTYGKDNKKLNKDINILVDMNNSYYCLNDKCNISNSNSMATANVSAYISNLLLDSKNKIIDKLKKDHYLLSFNYLSGPSLDKYYFN